MSKSIYVVLYSYGYNHDNVEVESAFENLEDAEVYVDNHDEPGNCKIVLTALRRGVDNG